MLTIVIIWTAVQPASSEGHVEWHRWLEGQGKAPGGSETGAGLGRQRREEGREKSRGEKEAF